ncbi:quinolinate synthase NadA [Clostridium magnum]|uniref:Quinolinate synthase n=1 Tax=Clostridium magnum DSM 2767 TaxID=1121326 RepID=A0A162T0W0_9CLOT|nr:quinolinate synthase NadA [Clostridium magnum]KZL92103.1 quinolinate synthase A [Clostridium magnum DSM 2767]SHH22306.1 quinolinate synthetase [Clostridium magnum DSM 2767]
MEINLKEEILRLKKEKGAIILAHYYQRPEIQDIADAVGDSYYLSKVAKDCDEKVIVFCGVKFMAESAKILSPEKTVLLPAIDAGCPMADMADAEGVKELKEKHPNAKIVCYINSSAEVKALSDVCCTSSNALKIIKNIKEEEIIFLPDKNLGGYIQEQVPEKKFIIWNGFCITHKKVKVEELEIAKKLHNGILIAAHPECEKPVRDAADFIGSTGEIINFVNNNSNEKFLIVTEEGVLHQIKSKNPEKKFYIPGGGMSCVNMKKTYLKDVYNSLLNMEYDIKIDEEIRLNAYGALINMHELRR